MDFSVAADVDHLVTRAYSWLKPKHPTLAALLTPNLGVGSAASVGKKVHITTIRA